MSSYVWKKSLCLNVFPQILLVNWWIETSIPGSSKCVKFVPFHEKNYQKEESLHISKIQVYKHLEDENLAEKSLL